jgi:hypothetical protein
MGHSYNLLQLLDYLMPRTYRFTYQLKITIQISLPQVMCPCVI